MDDVIIEVTEDVEQTPPVKRLTKADILAAPAVDTREVYLPRLGGSVLVKGLTRGAFHAARKQATKKGRGGEETLDLEQMEKYILVYGLADPQYSVGEIDALMNKSMDVVQRLMDAINDLSGMGADERAAAATAFRD